MILGVTGVLGFEANYAIATGAANRGNPAYVGAWVIAIVGVGVLLFYKFRGPGDQESSSAPVPTPPSTTEVTQTQSGKGNTQIAGDHNVVGDSNTIVHGDYYAATERKPLKDRGILVKREPEDFQKIYDENLTVNADKIVAPFLGKWMKLEGTVGDIKDYQTGTWNLTFEDFGNRLPRIFMHFDEAEYRERLEVLAKGDPVVVLGQIADIRANQLTLKHCELVDE